MTTAYVKRYRDALIPADGDARAAVRRLNEGATYRVEWHRARSPDQHRLLFALLHFALPQTEYRDPEELLARIKVERGHFTATTDGYRIPKSIAFDNMDQDQFNVFFDGACEWLAVHIGVTVEDLRAAAQLPAGIANNNLLMAG